MKKDILASIVCVVEAQETKSCPPSWGQALHGLVLRLVRDNNQALSKEWHDSSDIKPFSVSSLYGRFTKTSAGYKVVKGQRYWFKIGVIGGAGFDSLGDTLFPKVAETAQILISSTKFKLLDAKLDGHPWAALSSWSQLNKIEPNGNLFVLRFLSPTTFRRKKTNRILPDSELVFGSLLNRWNRFSPYPLDINLNDLLENIVISRFNLSTATHNLTTQPMLGFRGRCGFELLSGNQKLSADINKLANLAVFSGIGQKTTMGMGVARLEHQ